TWTELQALYDLHQQRVTGAIQHLHQRLPFALHAWHSDNGSEFINACLLGWCQRHQVRFTRGRPYRKNDQAWVEQRNGLLVRRLVASDRYRSRAALAVLQRLYGLRRLQHNFFRSPRASSPPPSGRRSTTSCTRSTPSPWRGICGRLWTSSGSSPRLAP